MKKYLHNIIWITVILIIHFITLSIFPNLNPVNNSNYVETHALAPLNKTNTIMSPLSKKFHDIFIQKGKINVLVVCMYNLERSIRFHYTLSHFLETNGLGNFVSVNSASPQIIRSERGGIKTYQSRKKNRIHEYDRNELNSLIQGTIKAMKSINISSSINQSNFGKQMSSYDISNADMIVILDDNLKHPSIEEETLIAIDSLSKSEESSENSKKIFQLTNIVNLSGANIDSFDVWNMTHLKTAAQNVFIPAIQEALNQYHLEMYKPENQNPEDTSV